LYQEEAHHAFGERILARAFATGAASPADLRERAQDYLALAHEMVTTLCDLFADIDEDAAAWASDATARMPGWFRAPRP